MARSLGIHQETRISGSATTSGSAADTASESHERHEPEPGSATKVMGDAVPSYSPT